MKRKGTLVILAALALVLGSALTFAAPHDHETHGILHSLGDILAELQVISGQLASGGSGGGTSDDQITGATSVDGLAENPSLTEIQLTNIDGPGKFLSARVTKQGGTSGITFVELRVDGQLVTDWSFAALKDWGLTANNPFGVTVSSPSQDTDSVLIGFQEPLVFQSSLQLSVQVNETGIQQITSTVIYGH
jgi:hypothetical protein